ncbi:MAG TPA: SGNH/GDSL hydrolase family protein [Stellaceae bacterium]|nr:SGNH/GDSL hydrolase family protein [Stellaceae bacterium]
MRRLAAAALGMTMGGALATAGQAFAAETPAPAGCAAPAWLTVIGQALDRSAVRVEGGGVKIVAIGSSSTVGIGASSPALSYPSRLEAELASRFPGAAIHVLNRGKGGEDAPEELARLGHDAIAEHPDLVIWQVGTNAVLRRDDLAADGELIEEGVARLQEGGSDVLLMDLQYAPRVVARPGAPTMERLIADAAKRGRVGLFRRFEIMRHWQNAAAADAPPMVGPDGLHMSDQGYRCLAADLATALADNWRAAIAARRREAASVAGLSARHSAAHGESAR